MQRAKLTGADILAAVFALAITLLTIAGKPETKDYISYWSAGQLLRQHADPYATPQVLALEQTQGYSKPKPLVMRNPPFALFLATPLGYVSAHIGLIIWALIEFGCIAALLVLLPFPPGIRWFAFCFTPALICIITGQSSCFLLLGLAMFLAWHEEKPFLAGVGILLMASKPHVFFLFWPILLIDSLIHRRFRLLAGGVIALLLAIAVATALDHNVWSQYSEMLRTTRIDTEILPTPAFLLRRAISLQRTWLQLIPSLCALIWAAWFYLRNWRRWRWSVYLAPLLFICLLTSPYVWMTDEIILLPPVLLTLACAEARKHAFAVLMVISVIPFIMLMAGISLPTGAYVWTTTAWLAWYIYSRGWRVLTTPKDDFSNMCFPATMTHEPDAAS